ncbi:MAG TPA: phenylalanine--tRNA ligase subunit beta, partial [Thermodesulfobacteriaceae bacterium]|nr:phenylalanine--tRNA ligase subunit beta [Thermodesulfobacteriaceae bacterium]
LRFPEIPELPLGEGLEKEAEVEILEPDLCYRYAGRLITGVTVGESPFWMAKKLWMCGLRPINNLVDVTNYVLLELGQPLHAFDWEKISGRKILVRRAREGESILTLDGERRALSPDMLVIADAERPVAVAGVMGGEESAVSESTQSVFLESAWFNSISIRRTARALKLSTESSYRFERGVDPEGVILALERATALILEIAGGKVIPGRIDKYPKAWQPQVINLRLTRLKSYLKVDLSEEETAEYLKRIGGEVESKGGVLSFRPPSFRHDLSFEEDLIEEVARLYGYDRLPVSMPVAELSATAPEREEILVNEIKDILRALGFYEVINYSFISPKSLEALELQKNDSRLQVLRLANPLAETQSIMRTTLIPGLLENARFNFFREIQRLKIFEIGKVFFPRGEELPEERISLGLLILGTSQPEFWGGESRRVDIYDLKGVLEALLRELSLAGVELRPYAEEPFLKRGCSFVIEAQGRKVGFAGEVKNYLRHKFELPAPVLLAEIDISGLLELPEVPKKFRGLPRYPATSRDLTM